MVAIDHGITCKISGLAISAALEAAGDTDQVRRGHSFREWIFSRTQHFTVNRNLGRIRLIAAENTNGIKGLQAWRFHALKHNVKQVERNHHWAEIRRMQAHNLRPVSRLGQKAVK